MLCGNRLCAAYLSLTNDGPRVFFNIEDWLKYNDNGRENRRFQAIWRTLRGECRGRAHWGKTGQAAPECFNGAAEFGRAWCKFGCAVRELDPAGKFSSAGAAYWNWEGTNLEACCGPDAAFSERCQCRVNRPACARYLS